MNMIRATITYIVMMGSTILIWFVLGRWAVMIVSVIGAAASEAEAAQVAQNVVNGLNLFFIFLLIIYTLWFAYVAHSKEHEVSYETIKY